MVKSQIRVRSRFGLVRMGQYESDYHYVITMGLVRARTVLGPRSVLGKS